MTNYANFLLEHGFVSISNKDDIVFKQSLEKTLSLFGTKFTESFLTCVSSHMQPDSFSTYYDCLKKELIHTFGEKAADTILTDVRENIEHEIGCYSNEQIPDILHAIKEEEILHLINDDFTATISPNYIPPQKKSKMTLTLWNSELFKDHLYYAFFDKDESEKLFFSSSAIPLEGVKTIPYEQLFEDRFHAIQKEIQITRKTLDNRVSMIYIGADDMTHYFREGLTDKFLDFRRSDHHYFDGTTINRLCGINMERDVNEHIMNKVISSFATVILEDPLSIYVRLGHN